MLEVINFWLSLGFALIIGGLLHAIYSEWRKDRDDPPEN